MNLKCYQSQIQLSEIRVVKYQLLLRHNAVVYIGYSLQSLKLNEYIYQVHQLQNPQKVITGKISIFGISFLTDYVKYNETGFINLISQSGRKIIQLNEFQKNKKVQIVKSIDYKIFQLKPVREKYGLSVHNSSIILVEITQNPPLLNIVIRKYSRQGQQQGFFRVLSFDTTPPFFFYKSNIYLINPSQITIFNNSLQPEYFEFSNGQNIIVHAVHEQFIITYKDCQQIYFSMNIDGRVMMLIQQAKFCSIKDRFIYFIVESSTKQKTLIQMSYDKGKSRYIKTQQIKLPVDTMNQVLIDQWIKLDLESSTQTQNKFLKISN